jgi:type I restriction enzyme, S subunit
MSAAKVTLGEASDMISGFAFKSQQFLDSSEDGIYLVRGENVQQRFLRWGEKAKRWRRDDYDELARYQLQRDDVILAMDRPIVGGGLKLAWIKDQDLPSLLVQRVSRIRGVPGVARTNYLRYALSGTDFFAHIDRITTGANIPHISGKDIANHELCLPDLESQDRIVEILGAYDDLIENNQTRIALLEESARLLYREWFLCLRFPGVDSQRRSTALPTGWTLGSTEALALSVNRGIAPRYDESATGLVINQKCIRGGRLSLDPSRRQSREVMADRQVRVGDVLINSTGAGTLGRVAQVRAPLQDCTVDTHVTIVRPNDPKTAAYLGVALLEKEALLSTMGVGSTNQLELGRADISALPLLIPPESLRTAFHELVWPIFTQVESLAQSNENLRQARDGLLPKLISGELTV